MKDASPEAAPLGLRAHARRLHVGVRRPHNWLQLARYCVVGASGYVVNLGVYTIALTWLPYRLAFTVAFVVAASTNFASTGGGRSGSTTASPTISTPAS